MKGRSLLRLPVMPVRTSRQVGLGLMACMLLGTSAHAQATLDFIDPLDTERVRIEQKADPATRSPATRDLPPPRLGTVPERNDGDSVLIRTRDGAAAGAEAVRGEASGFWATLRATLSSVAAALGLPVSGLVALLALLLAGLAALVGWTLFRGRGRAAGTSGDVYARSSRESAKRRALGSAIPARTRAVEEEPDFEEPDFEETMPEDFDTIFADENDDPVKRREPAESADAAKWRKPNLDRLRDSIKADWKADKEEKKRDGAVTPFATARPAAAPSATADPATRSLGDLSDGWEEWDAQDKPEDDPWGETASARENPKEDDDETAMHRIRALRDSLRAS